MFNVEYRAKVAKVTPVEEKHVFLKVVDIVPTGWRSLDNSAGSFFLPEHIDNTCFLFRDALCSLGKKVHSKVVIQPSRKQQVPTCCHSFLFPTFLSRKICTRDHAHPREFRECDERRVTPEAASSLNDPFPFDRALSSKTFHFFFFFTSLHLPSNIENARFFYIYKYVIFEIVSKRILVSFIISLEWNKKSARRFFSANDPLC